jgi:hypothetical protein
VVPELGVYAGFQYVPWVRATVGYNVLAANHILRPADVLNPLVNLAQSTAVHRAGALTGPAQPAFAFRDSDFWLQGINVGLEFRY